MPTTSSPRARSRSHTCMPIKPAAPVTRTFTCFPEVVVAESCACCDCGFGCLRTWVVGGVAWIDPGTAFFFTVFVLRSRKGIPCGHGSGRTVMTAEAAPQPVHPELVEG